MQASLIQSPRPKALVGLTVFFLAGAAGGCGKSYTCTPVPLTAPWTSLGLPLGADVTICSSNGEKFKGSQSKPAPWSDIARSIHAKLVKDGWSDEPAPTFREDGFDVGMRKGDKGILIMIDAAPGQGKTAPFTITVAKYWPSGQPSAEW